MTPEEQRIAIAIELEFSPPFRLKPFGPDFLLIDSDTDVVPDFLNDLNAMNEAEKVLDGHPRCDDFGDYLAQTVLGFGPGGDGVLTLNAWSLRRILRATAAQRAEAFLKAKGLWKL